VALAAALVLTGCGGGSESAEETAPPASETTEPLGTEVETTEALDTEVPDLCTLFTAEDFESVTDETAGEPESDDGMGAIRGTCTISAEAGFPMVLIGAYNESDRDATMAMVDAESVDDLGTEAYWDDTVGLMVPLEGKDWYLQVMATDGGADLATSTEVARIALDRLDG
jgi:hypothetical protein